MPRQTEPSANNALGALLQRMMRDAEVRSENVRAFADHPGLQPDILITSTGRAPVVVEAEFEPARTVEDEANSRLGLEVAEGRRSVEAVIALRYPADVADAANLHDSLSDARLEYCVFHAEPPDSRFPESGWVSGSVSDLADMIQLVSVPQRAVDAAADALEQGIERVAAILDDLAEIRPNVTQSIAQLLSLADLPQTRRMACAIIANAMVFHERIAGMHPGVKPLNLVCGPNADNPQDETISAWTYVLDEINYWPIFAIAKDLLQQLPPRDAARALRDLRDTAQRIDTIGVNNSHDLTGRIFQRLISDRKYLATFYTLPASAALLARLAMAKMDGVDWSSADAIGALRIGDFACGTGALLSAVYERIATRHERAGGNPEDLHPVMMQDVLYGCDVMPSAIHITGSTLSGIQPDVKFEMSRLYTLAYGRQDDGSVKIGSLELLQSSETMTLFNTSDPALRTGSAGEETAARVNVDIPDNGFDLVIMNPPFTRATNHEGAHARVVDPAFAAFGASKRDMGDMGARMREMGSRTCYHGNAGLASAFAALADKKLKPGGVLAMVLPLSVSAGKSWQKFRSMLNDEYSDLEVLSIAADDKDMSFSSDTGMAECLVIARKRSVESQTVRFTSLYSRPDGFAESAEIAKSMKVVEIRGIEDGPYGGAPVAIGNDQIGDSMSAQIFRFAPTWNPVRVSDGAVAQVAHALANSKLWLPTFTDPLDLKVTILSNVGKRGLVDRLILGPPHPAPFTKAAPSPTATYPCLWNHDAKKETRMVCEPDSQLRVRLGMESRAAEVWATASRAHVNRDFRFNSQPLAAVFTEQESIGGVAWPNVKFSDVRFDYAFVVCGNSTLGQMLFWWHSNRQQSGRGRITISSAETLPILDLRALTDEQLATARDIFEQFRELDLQPAYLADADPNRAMLDRRVICDLLGFDRDIYQAVRRLAEKWCAEPSVHGGKKRPKRARLLM